MVENTNVEFGPAIRTALLALVAVLGVPTAVYFGLRGPLGAQTANGLALGFSVGIALAVIALLLRRDG